MSPIDPNKWYRVRGSDLLKVGAQFDAALALADESSALGSSARAGVERRTELVEVPGIDRSTTCPNCRTLMITRPETIGQAFLCGVCGARWVP